jgi:hypothetical protein
MPIKFNEISAYHRKVRDLAQRYAQALTYGSSPELIQSYHQDLLRTAEIYRGWFELREKLQDAEFLFRVEIEEYRRQNRPNQNQEESQQNQA